MHHDPSRRLLLAAFAGAALPAAPARAQAQPFPTRPVRLVVPVPPGGATDTLARAIASKLSERWKQPVVIENRPGANATIGADQVAKSAPDGHTLGIVTGAHSVNPMLMSKLPYDTFGDLTGVMQLTRAPMAIYAHTSVAASNPVELAALMKKERLTYGSSSALAYLGMELLTQMMGVKGEYVPYKGSAQAIADLVGGHLKLMIDPVLNTTLQQVQAGKLKLIGTLAAKPSPLTPGVPSFAAVAPGYDFSAIFGLVARAGTAPATVRFIRDEIAAVMAMPDVADNIRVIGQEAVASTPDEYNALVLSEMRKWEPVVKATGARLD